MSTSPRKNFFGFTPLEIPDDLIARNHLAHRLLWLLGILFISRVIFYFFPDPDLFGHLKFGLDAIKAGHPLYYDRYSYTAQGLLWINHEWLTEVCYGVLYSIGGFVAIEMAKRILCIAIALLIWRSLRDQIPSSSSVAIFVWMFIFITITPGLATRPQLMTFLFCVLLVQIVPAHLPPIRGSLWKVPVIMALWANFHGGYCAGLGYLFLIYCGRGLEWFFLKKSYPRLEQKLFFFGLFATLLNGYGPLMWWGVLRALLNPVTVVMIQDWLVFRFHIFQITDYAFLFFVILGFVDIFRRLKKKEWTPILVYIVLIVVAYRNVRNIYLYVLLGLPLIGDALEACLEKFQFKFEIAFTKFFRMPIFLFGYVVVLLWTTAAVGQRVIPEYLFPMRPPVLEYPVQAAQFLKMDPHLHRNPMKRYNLACGFNWGQYLIWTLYPEFLVSMDGRHDTVYPGRMFKDLEYDIFFKNSDRTENNLDKYKSDLALIPIKNRGLLRRLEKSDRWKKIFTGRIAVVFQRTKAAG